MGARSGAHHRRAQRQVHDDHAGDPWGGERVASSATTHTDWRDFGLLWNQPLESGGILIGNEVRIEVEAQAVLQPNNG